MLQYNERHTGTSRSAEETYEAHSQQSLRASRKLQTVIEEAYNLRTKIH